MCGLSKFSAVLLRLWTIRSFIFSSVEPRGYVSLVQIDRTQQTLLLCFNHLSTFKACSPVGVETLTEEERPLSRRRSPHTSQEVLTEAQLLLSGWFLSRSSPGDSLLIRFIDIITWRTCTGVFVLLECLRRAPALCSARYLRSCVLFFFSSSLVYHRLDKCLILWPFPSGATLLFASLPPVAPTLALLIIDVCGSITTDVFWYLQIWKITLEQNEVFISSHVSIGNWIHFWFFISFFFLSHVHQKCPPPYLSWSPTATTELWHPLTDRTCCDLFTLKYRSTSFHVLNQAELVSPRHQGGEIGGATNIATLFI